MEDIMGMVGQIMSDPEQMKQLSSLAASLGLSPDASAPEPEAPSTAPLINDGTLTALLPLIQKLQNSSDDRYITFLRALQPLLSDKRKPKVDTAIMLLKLITFTPYLEESGILPKNNILQKLGDLLKGGD